MGRGRRRSWFVAAVAALLLAPPGTALAQQRISVAEFIRRLENARDLAIESVDAISPEKMDAIRGMVGLPLTVEYPGWIVAIPEDPLLEALDGDVPQDFQQAARRCAALLRDARRALATRPVDDEELRGALERAYQGVGGEASPGIVERIGEATAGFFRSLASLLVRFRGLGTVLAWAVVALLVALLAWAVATVGLVPERKLRARAGPTDGADQGDWRSSADRAVAEGNLREAVRLLYRALLAALARRGVLSESASVTAGECRDRVRASRPSIYPVVLEATQAFERVVYGQDAAGAADVETLRRAERLAGGR